MTQQTAPNTEPHKTAVCPHCGADLRAGPALPNALEAFAEVLRALTDLMAWVDPTQTYFLGNAPALDAAYVAIGKDRSNVIECVNAVGADHPKQSEPASTGKRRNP